MYNVMYTLKLIQTGKEHAVAQMIRKQIYLERTQQYLLARLAKARGVSEAEVIRQAIEHEATAGHVQSVVPDATALDEIVQFALSRREAGVTGEPLRWNREDAYEERFERYGI
jgi:hypothetical protein